MTAATTDIRLTLAAGVSSDKAIDALYAFTDCEVSISPNCCVIYEEKPLFTTVSELLRYSVERTKFLFGEELKSRIADDLLLLIEFIEDPERRPLPGARPRRCGPAHPYGCRTRT